MPPKKVFILLLILVTIFVTVGDQMKFMPPEFRTASLQSRKFVVNLWPKWLKPKDLNEQREKDIENLGR